MAPPRRHTYMVASKPNTFGDRLRRLRVSRGWVQTQLAEASDVGQSVISKYERGEVQYPDPDAIGRLEKTFGVPKGELMQLAMADHMNLQGDIPNGSLVIHPDDDAFEFFNIFKMLRRKAQDEIRRGAEYLLKEQAKKPESDEMPDEAASA